MGVLLYLMLTGEYPFGDEVSSKGETKGEEREARGEKRGERSEEREARREKQGERNEEKEAMREKRGSSCCVSSVETLLLVCIQLYLRAYSPYLLLALPLAAVYPCCPTPLPPCLP